MNARQRSGVRPAVEVLEDRLNPGTLSWPLGATNGFQPLFATYGQYTELGSVHIHEGTDVLPPPGAGGLRVRAIQGGTIIAIIPSTQPFLSTMVVLTTEPDGSQHGWNYGHVVASRHPTENRTWRVGDVVQAGNVLGQVAPLPNNNPGRMPQHIHVDYGNSQADTSLSVPTPAGAAFPYRIPVDNPQAYLINPDTTAPTVSARDIHFRLASEDQNGQVVTNALGQVVREIPQRNHYFAVEANGVIAAGSRAQAFTTARQPANGSANIDIIAAAFDEVVPAGRHLGVNSITAWVVGNDNFRQTDFTFAPKPGFRTGFDFSENKGDASILTH